MHGKKICGFALTRYIQEELPKEKFNEFKKWISEDINSGGKLFGTKIAKEMKLEEWNKALDQVE